MNKTMIILIGLAFSTSYANDSIENTCVRTKTCYSTEKPCPILHVIKDDESGYIAYENLEEKEIDSYVKTNF